VERERASTFAPNHDEVLLELADARNYNSWLFERARPYLGSSALDVGAGIGTFTDLAASATGSIVAVEPDPAFAKHLAARFADRPGVEVVNADLADLDSSRRFDSIVCFNVLEHIGDDSEALGLLHGLLRPGGRLLLLVPAHAWLWSPFDEAVGHQRRYARPALEQALRRSGLAVDEIRYVNPVGGLGWLVSMRLMGRRTLSAGQTRAFDRIVPVVRPLDRLRLPFGQSLWAVARRP
jgi:SAM-dependent methyltransferase